MTNAAKATEVDRNLEAFLKELPDLKKLHPGKYALLRHQSVVEVFDTMRDAHVAGTAMFDDGLFSVQKIDESPINLGFFSHAVHMAATQ